ncbi:MAG: PD40 domain-containing protein [Alphaproteobacteria bacterium]|nr:PD40 domain-containing protein [Alphaproteobacteria bacterium]
MRIWAGVSAAALMAGAVLAGGAVQAAPQLLQSPAIHGDMIAFGYAGDLWVVSRAGGAARRLTTGVGIESTPIFSPDGQTLAFTGEYDGNTDVFTVPVAGGVPHRVTYHPATDAAVGWTPDGKAILFRSDRDAHSRYTRLFEVPAAGGPARPLPLPMAYSGELAPDGASIAYTPLAPAFGFDFRNYTAWGNYHGGRAGVIWITDLKTLDSRIVPHTQGADFSPVHLGGKIYFLSGRDGPVSVFAYDPASGQVAEVFKNTGPDIRSLSTDGQTLAFDRLGEIFTLVPGGAPTKVEIDARGDLPDVRVHFEKVGDQVEHVSLSPSGLRVAVEAHGEIFTVPVDKKGYDRDLTSTPGVAEREPAWSPDGQSVAYFSDESGLYALHVASQDGAEKGVRKFPLAPEAAYYFGPIWSPDSKKIAFYDNRLHVYVLDLASGRLSAVGEPDAYGGFTDQSHAMAWSPDSAWLVYPHYQPNHMHTLMLYNVASGGVTQLTDAMADARFPTFDRGGKYLYFTASNNAGARQFTLDMTSDLYQPTASLYALALTARTAALGAPDAFDEPPPAPEGPAKEAPPAARGPDRSEAPAAKPVAIDLAGLSVEAIASRIEALPAPASVYSDLTAGKGGALYALQSDPGANARAGARWVLYDVKTRKSETLADHLAAFELSRDGDKALLTEIAPGGGDNPYAPPKLAYAVVGAHAPAKPGDGALDLSGLEVRVDPAREWAQMYHEIWRIERAYFYEPNFHGYDTQAAEARLLPYVAAVQSRADLNYLFQEMLTGFSIGHLRGAGGAIPNAHHEPGGLLGADYALRDGRYCLATIYTGGSWSPDVRAPLARPGLDVKVGDCITAIDGQPVSAQEDIQAPLEGTAGRAITLTLARGGEAPHDIAVVPVASEARLRNLDWIDANRREVDRLSGGRLAYVYMPDTGQGGFTAFNRYYFAQTDKQGAIIDERFNAGGQIANYVIEVLERHIDSYWTARYGAIEHSTEAGIYGPKVMIANEVSGSGGDAMPWLFKHNHLGPLVGKRTWGGLVGIGPIPVLMDGGRVTSPSVGFFSPKGTWDVENHGVDPDIAVEMDPKSVAAGHDPQLEAAVAAALDQLKDHPPATPTRPAFPNYHAGSGD